jgi:hypothetical protein
MTFLSLPTRDDLHNVTKAGAGGLPIRVQLSVKTVAYTPTGLQRLRRSDAKSVTITAGQSRAPVLY